MISFVIPALNEAKIIKKTLAQFGSLNNDNWEVIVSDGGSTDGTVELLKASGVKTVLHLEKKKQTIAFGRNVGAQVAMGDLLIFMDADVEIPDLPKFVKVIQDRFNLDTNLVGATVKIRVSKENETWADLIIFWCMNAVYYLVNNVFKKGGAAGELQIIRNSVFKKINGYNPVLVAAEDVDMFSRLRKMGSTKMFYDLVVYHTGRRAHVIGWPRLLFTWLKNVVYLKLFKKSASQEWKVIR